MAPSHMDVRLDWLIASSGIDQRDAFRRLNAIENQLANLASRVDLRVLHLRNMCRSTDTPPTASYRSAQPVTTP